MARQTRVKLDPYTPAYYHVHTRVVERLFHMVNEDDKQAFLNLLCHLTQGFFMKILAFQVMDNHFHLVIKVHIDEDVSLEEVREKYCHIHPDRMFLDEGKQSYQEYLGDLSMFMKTLNERYASQYNRLHNRSGHFWGDRFKSGILADTEAVVNCMGYVGLNAVRARMVEEREDYIFGSINHVTKNKNQYQLIDIPEISALMEGTMLGENEQEVREEFNQTMNGDDKKEKDGYLKYIAFVKMKKQAFLHRVESFTRQATIGTITSLRALHDQLGIDRQWRYSPLPDSNLLLAR